MRTSNLLFLAFFMVTSPPLIGQTNVQTLDSLDVRVTRIISPANTVPYGAPWFPEIVVHNCGNLSVDSITLVLSGFINTTEMLCSQLLPGDSTVYQFSNGLPFYSPNLCMKAFSQISGDLNHSNDTAELCLWNDIFVKTILYPIDTIHSGSLVYPQFLIINIGQYHYDNLEYFFVYDGDTSQTEWLNHPVFPGDTIDISLTQYFTAKSGIQPFCVIVNAPGDIDSSNNVLCADIVGISTIGVDAPKLTSPKLTAIPNPARLVTTINYSGELPVIIAIFDAMGRKIYEETMDMPKLTFHLESMQSGIFLVRLEGDSYKETIRLIIEQ